MVRAVRHTQNLQGKTCSDYSLDKQYSFHKSLQLHTPQTYLYTVCPRIPVGSDKLFA